MSATPSPTEGLTRGGGGSPYDPELMDLQEDGSQQDGRQEDAEAVHKVSYSRVSDPSHVNRRIRIHLNLL